MQRRTLLKNLLAASVAVPLGAQAVGAAPADAAPPLDAARWAPHNAQRLQAAIRSVGRASPGYLEARRPYAVFDWDNTCIMNDCEEALLMYQIEEFAFRLAPDEFALVLRQNVPAGPFKAEAGHVTTDGKPVTMADLADDVDDAYRWLHENRSDGMTVAQLREMPQFENLRAKLYFMYEAICDTHPIEVGYKWVIGFLANMTPAQLRTLATAAIQRGLGDALSKVKLLSSYNLPGKAGVVAASHFRGLRVNDDIRALMHTLRANGIDVYVSTASLDDVVRAFACDPDLGYGVVAENVIGLRLEMRDGKYTSVYRKGWHFNWGAGKTVGIRAVLGGRGDPAMVFGDSDGDAWMLRDFAGTEISMMINRVKGGEIGKLGKLAAGSAGRADARYLLQGRNEHTGMLLPDERTLKYGKSERALLAAG
ncbi:haloacid dehalogenase-like hydrolase [Janthinobacterium fluminis]|uniref:Haloacid dehalogenase-like hydrolase n=1 Tax=Janthinobacterium fluminis TaxID=2987524 RepID=A0ABT5JXB6_9BURK|nr:haloacid dehalogenase-like hydrolase [Janthinobacterium fluminis]MDC8756790.1 haloacid dehalogenase-like hydrolase [Janthinobacterium fluminis]